MCVCVCVCVCVLQYYLLMQPQVRPVDRDNLLNDVKTKMERMIQKRVEAVRVRVRRGRCLLRLHSLLSLVRWQDKLSPPPGGGAARRQQFDSRRIYVRPRTGPQSAHG